MKAAGPSEMLVNFCLTELCHVAEHTCIHIVYVVYISCLTVHV